MFYNLLSQNGLIKGKIVDYPFDLRVVKGLGYKDIEVKSLNELYNLIENFMSDLINKEKKLKDVLYELGIENTVMLIDGIQEIIRELEYYSSPATIAAPHDSDVFVEYLLAYEHSKPKLF